MAEAVVEERQLLKKLRWYDGFVIALATPGFLLGSLGYSVGDLGGWGAVLLWGISAALAFPIMTLYSEMAAMFPDKPGGFPLYAHEGWRKHFTLVGPVATFGYWLGWSVVLSFLGLFSGQIIQGAWFPGAPVGSPLDPADNYFKLGDVGVGLPHLIAAGLILAVWLFNVFGVRVGIRFAYLAGILLMFPLFCFMILPFLNGDWSSSNLTWGALDGTAGSGEDATALTNWEVVRLSIVWLWIMAWSSWGVDTCATFAPEYKDTVNDTRLALRSACIFTFVVFILLPLGLVGGVGEETVAAFDYVGALEQLTGSERLTDFFVVVIVASFLISMNTATADGGRALYGIALDDLTMLGPIFVLKLRFFPKEFARKMVAEMWLYPDGSRVLELSTKCVPSEAFQVAAEARAFLASRGVSSEGEQETKTRKALEFYSAAIRAADGPHAS